MVVSFISNDHHLLPQKNGSFCDVLHTQIRGLITNYASRKNEVPIGRKPDSIRKLRL